MFSDSGMILIGLGTMQCISPLAVTMLGYEHSFHVSFLKDVFIYLKGKERESASVRVLVPSWFPATC